MKYSEIIVALLFVATVGVMAENTDPEEESKSIDKKSSDPYQWMRPNAQAGSCFGNGRSYPPGSTFVESCIKYVCQQGNKRPIQTSCFRRANNWCYPVNGHFRGGNNGCVKMVCTRNGQFVAVRDAFQCRRGNMCVRCVGK